MNKIVAKATFLDPRFKKTAFELLENANNVQKWISDELTPIICANNDIDNTEVNRIQSTTTASTSNTSNSI